MEAIILAGGLGTRLRSTVRDVPKPMAPILNKEEGTSKPFLEYLLTYLKNQGVTRIILSVGYLSEVISDYFGSNFKDIEIIYAVENTPLGTGGAIKNALSFVHSEDVFCLNGDTMLAIDFKEMYCGYQQSGQKMAMALREMSDVGRYGTAKIEGDLITGFEASQDISNQSSPKAGWINGGIYLFKKSMLMNFETADKFSFEEEILEKKIASIHPYAYKNNAPFIDIGIPDDFHRAGVFLQTIKGLNDG